MRSNSAGKYAGQPPTWTGGSRLSRSRTSYPRASSASAVWEPMKPAPPVIRIRIYAELELKTRLASLVFNSNSAYMRILITGGAGFIGSHTAEALLARGYDVRLLDSLEPPVPVDRWPPYLAAEFERMRGDVRDPDTVAKALAGVDVVYHLAAYQDYLPDFSHFINVNAASTALIYEIIVSQGLPVRKVIVASSQAVLGEGLYHCPNHGQVLPDSRSREQLEAGLWDLPCPHCQAAMTPVPATELVGNPQNPYGISKQCQ